MEKKYILILGAGLMQKPAMEAALSLGYKTLVVDANPSALLVPFANRFEPVDLKDKDGLLNLALSVKDELAAVFTAGTDFSASVSYVAQHCGLPSHSYEVALNASNKARMRDCFKQSGVPSPSFMQIDRSQIAALLSPQVLSTMTFPKVVKPVDNMGARGCRLIRNKDEFLASVEEAARCSRSGLVILEDYMEGPEFSIDAIVYNGTFTITGFADRHIQYSPYFIEMGHTMPSAFDENKKYELIKAFARAAYSLGLSCGVAKADIKYTKNGPMIGEIAARLSGGYMSGWTYPYASGLNLTKEALLVALGKEPEELLSQRKVIFKKDENIPFDIYDVPCKNTSAERAWISAPGEVQEVYNLDKAAASPFVKDVFSRAQKGSLVDFPRNNVEKCGNCISLATSRDCAVSFAQKAVSSVVLRLKAHNAETDAFLSRVERRDEADFPPDAFVLTAEQKEAFDSFMQNLSLDDVITGDAPVAKQIPRAVLDFADSLKDWNYRSIRQSLELFDAICPKRGNINAALFWNTLLRAGVQGIIYLADCGR